MDFCKGMFGRFRMEEPACYEMNCLDMETSWEYIYQNREILLRLDQFGPVNAQLDPPEDIMLFKREKDDRFSKWLVWMQADEVYGGQPFTNFFRPVTVGNPRQTPQNLKITFRPEEAVYAYELEGLKVTTRFFVPDRGTVIHMEFSVENTRQDAVVLHVTPVLAPSVSAPQLPLWDKAEWYLKTGFGIEKEAVFWTRMLDSGSVREKRRTAVLWSSREQMEGFEISLEKYKGAGDFFHPEAVFQPALRLTPEDCGGYGSETEKNQIYGYPPVYALRYRYELQAGGCAKLQQTLGVPEQARDYGLQTLAQAEKTRYLFDEAVRKAEKEARGAFFAELFGKRRIKTAQPFFDHYVNSWLPLQMYWTASLDRGWPTGMRGTRDCANDFMGEVYLDAQWAEEMLLLLFSCQRTDGWFPRQISAKGRKGQHDMREFVDGGAFVIEFLHEYLCVTGDFEMLQKPLKWLDAERENPVIEHAAAAVDYYLREENTGVHGLCKIRGGDWLDAVNCAGLEGIGESVMVTCQAIMAVTFLERIAQAVSYEAYDAAGWRQKQAQMKAAVRKHAYNRKGFFNGVYTDAEQWIFSDEDPDGETRPYVCANAYAILSGAAEKMMRKTAIEAVKTLKSDAGYRLFYPPIGKKPVEKVGRSGSGDGLMGLFENAAPYNHGSHGFWGRCMAEVGEADEVWEICNAMLPFHMGKHPTAQALTPPYAVVNCWQKIPLFENRGGMLFLTGSIAMALRLVYNWMAGIKPGLQGLVIEPCISRVLGEVEVQFQARGKHLSLHIEPEGREVYLDGHKIQTYIQEPFMGKTVCEIPYEELKEGSRVEVRKS